MESINKETIFKRFDEAAYDLALASISNRKGNKSEFIKHQKDAGEAISQTLEYSLKFHLNKNLSEVVKRQYSLFKQDLFRLIRYYVDEDGKDNGFLYATVDDSINPTVNFDFFIRNKNAITNASKHEGGKLNFDLQKDYLEEVRKFIKEYIDEDQRLRTIEDFEKVDLSTWDLLYSACDRFILEERNYILIIGPNKNIDSHYLKNLAIPKWNLIIDFDYLSESEGFFNIGFKNNEISPHIFKAVDVVNSNSFTKYSQSHYHYFANNYKGSGAEEIKEFSDWNRKVGKTTEIFLKSFSDVFSSQKNMKNRLIPN